MNNFWYKKNFLSYLLLPFTLIYLLIIFFRRKLYQFKILKSYRASIPIIVVGNITVGGTGKTPLVIAIVNHLKNQGFRPGIITRGYRGKSKTWPQLVAADTDPALVGDEAVLMARATSVPVVAGPNRVGDVRLLEKNCDVIVSDDGLQHYALQRDIEIAVVDGLRQYGNGLCLPAGPLREQQSRLQSVDFLVVNSPSERVQNNQTSYAMQFVIDNIVSMHNATLFERTHTHNVIAIAGIGNPERFFSSLQSLKIAFHRKIFPDHHHFVKTDFHFAGHDDVIIMTEKDAVKCAAFSDARFYVARGHAVMNEQFFSAISNRLSVISNQ